MGLLIESLLGIPFEEGRFQVYVFIIGDTVWKGGVLEIVHNNFDELSKAIGRNALLVKGFKGNYKSSMPNLPKDELMHFGDEVCRQYLGKSYKELSEHLPALLLTDSHPNEMNDDALRLLIPLEKLNRTDYIIVDRFFELLASFTRGESDKFLDVLIASNKSYKKIGEFVDIDKLKIPFTPFAINVDKFLEKATKWFSELQTNSETVEKKVDRINKQTIDK